ncbi:hydroxyacylglutathione hydrolase [Marinicella meishanensis]|uniref:hydroxyacylglutathione hydrolase n=1 Tax=Marinicella meishanensis TaxID=2873263 RepID=UPI001CBDA934|nr:hydroxyacylglutathione hydrolase [Marinicella sp. NBU2979]
MSFQITPIPAFNDNYIWVIDNGQLAVVVDPGVAAHVDQFLSAKQLHLHSILITHHHWDHVNGVESLQQQHACPVYAPADERIPGQCTVVQEGSLVELTELGLQFQVLETPGHTLTHVCYVNQDWLFCGDTLFSMGCGRMFEGKPNQFNHSLNKIKSLPDDLKVFCTHEYTLSNLQFARHLEPDNADIAAFEAQIQASRQANQPSLPSQLGLEKQLNPFLRTDQAELRQAVAQIQGSAITDEVTCFAHIRALKDQF